MRSGHIKFEIKNKKTLDTTFLCFLSFFLTSKALVFFYFKTVIVVALEWEIDDLSSIFSIEHTKYVFTFSLCTWNNEKNKNKNTFEHLPSKLIIIRVHWAQRAKLT